MSSTRFNVEKFTGKNDFGLWRIKMKALLTQQGIVNTLKDGKDFHSRHSDTQKEHILQKAHSARILCLGDKVLREVSKEMSVADVWKKLEQLYLKKSVVNRLYLKQHLYSYKLTEERGLSELLEEFNKSIDDLENII